MSGFWRADELYDALIQQFIDSQALQDVEERLSEGIDRHWVDVELRLDTLGWKEE